MSPEFGRTFLGKWTWRENVLGTFCGQAWLAGLAGWLAGWLTGRLAGWAAGWLASWLGGWPGGRPFQWPGLMY